MDNLISLHILLTSIGRKSIFDMLYSIKEQLQKNDFLTIVYDAIDIDNTFKTVKNMLKNFSCNTNLIMEAHNRGYWGHGIRNKYKYIINDGDFILHADDDDKYTDTALPKVREICRNKNNLYLFRYTIKKYVFWRTKEIKMNNIGTPSGVIPLKINIRGTWGHFYGGDGYFYIQLLKTLKKNEKIIYVNNIFYIS